MRGFRAICVYFTNDITQNMSEHRVNIVYINNDVTQNMSEL